MPRDLVRMNAYAKCMKEHEALKEVAEVISRYLPGDFSLTREEAVSEIIEILEKSDIFNEIGQEAPHQAA